MTKTCELLALEIKKSFTREIEIETEGNDTKVAQISLKNLVYNLSERLRGELKNFDVVQFYIACGLTEQDFMRDYIPF